jgi:6-pyruvoyltetrahydropterin/6-carboxytetrahydropterin synthase
MATLTRTVRFCVNPRECRDGPWSSGPNGYGGVPSMRGLGRQYELEVRCAGPIDATTGYLINIKSIDHAVRRAAIPLVERACDGSPCSEPGEILGGILSATAAELPGIVRAIRWKLTPYYSVEMISGDHGTVLLRQKFDFAASHRLHVPTRSDAENRALFGKCNNAGGHGHNYQFEPCVAVRLRGGRQSFLLHDLERLAEDTVVQRFDHKNLSCDVPEFAPETGVNPSVEQIARVFFELLAPAVRRESPDAELRSVTVWETDRTSSTYPGE